MALQTIHGRPYVGTGLFHVYRVKTDTADAYEADENMIYLEGSLVSSNFSVSATTTPFYADDTVQDSDTAYAPSASVGYAGDTPELDELMFGRVLQGGAILDNIGAVPECGCFFVMRQTKNKWIVRQILKFTAAKDSVDVSTKTESTTFTSATATLTPLFSNHFNSYVRDFYSDAPELAGMTAQDVINALKEDPAHEFTAVQEV